MNNNQEAKPRAFWLREEYGNECDLCDYEPNSFHSVYNEHIHVVEYAALEKANERIKELEEALSEYRKAFTGVIK